MSVGARLLGVNRTSIYYKGRPVSEEELACKEIIDHLHTDNPAWGTRQMSAQLKARGYHIGRCKARRYMDEMDIYPIYPKMNLSKRMQQAKVCPYLLRNAVIDKPNQAWSIDITYIPIKRGFLYLTAVIDWYSRCIVGWEVDDTLDTRMVISALEKAFKVAKPQILNSDQGCQFTSQRYIDFVKDNGIRQSMDGKSRWALLCSIGILSIRLGWVNGNPQAEHFWHKNGFAETGITYDTGNYIVVVAQKDL